MKILLLISLHLTAIMIPLPPTDAYCDKLNQERDTKELFSPTSLIKSRNFDIYYILLVAFLEESLGGAAVLCGSSNVILPPDQCLASVQVHRIIIFLKKIGWRIPVSMVFRSVLRR